jgi:GT2 family glycosyltransferase
MKISAIVPTHDRYDSLCRTLDSIRLQTNGIDVELVVIDDASNPPIPLPSTDIKLVRFDKNVGACIGRNSGVNICSGDLLLFIDDDAELINEDTLIRAVQWFTNWPELGVVGFRQLTPERKVHYMQPANTEIPVRSGVFFSYGCLVRREAFDIVKGFNEEFGYYYEEIELSLKLLSAGYEVIYDPTLVVIHHQDDRHRNWANIRRKITCNALLSYLIHYPYFMLFGLIPKRLFFHAQQIDYQIGQWLSDIQWVSGELFRRRSYIFNNHKAISLSTIKRFHALCNYPEAIPSEVDTSHLV